MVDLLYEPEQRYNFMFNIKKRINICDSKRWLYVYLVILTAILGIIGCAKKPVAPPKGKKPVIEVPPVTDAKVSAKEDEKISIVDILSAEAFEFSVRGNFQEALFIYNQALFQADEKNRPPIIEKIESVLSKTPAKDIQAVIYRRNIVIPRAILLYWLGLNYALEGEILKSKDTLESFLFQFPGHAYAQDVSELIHEIKKAVFKKDTMGVLLPLSGKYAVFGQRALTGIQLALQELAKTHHRNFKIIVKDTKADPERAVQAVQQLHAQNVAGIIGPLLTVTKAGQTAQKLQIPLIALTQKSDFPIQGDFLFSNFITPQMQVKTLGSYLFQTLNIRKVAILYPDEKYGRRYLALFWDIVDYHNGRVVGVESYDGAKTDFTTPIQKLTGEFYPLPEELKTEEAHSQRIDSDALFIPDSPSKIKLILPQLAFNDAKGMILVGTNLWHHDSLLKDTRGYNRNAVIADGFFSDSHNPAIQKFKNNYHTVFNKTPEFLEAIAYDTVGFLFSTAIPETVDSRIALKEALLSGATYSGVTGETSFDENGAAQRDLFLITIKSGKFVEIQQ